MEQIDELFKLLESKDGKIRYHALQELIQITDQPVEWVYDKWYELENKLSSDNSYQRSIGLMLLANIAKSDTENRMVSILDKYLGCFCDEKFITSRQCIQTAWKIAISNASNGKKVIQELEKTYFENIHLKTHGNLIKEDVVSCLCQIAKHSSDQAALLRAEELLNKEIDSKLIKSLKKALTK
jgi:hypothetical protein